MCHCCKVLIFIRILASAVIVRCLFLQDELEQKIEQLKMDVPSLRQLQQDDEEKRKLMMQTGWTEEPYSKKQVIKMQDKVILLTLKGLSAIKILKHHL